MSSTYGANCLYHNMLIVKSWNFFQARLINNAHKFHLNDVLVGFMQLFEKISVELIVSFPHVCPIKTYAQDDALFRSTFLSGMAETFLNLLHP